MYFGSQGHSNRIIYSSINLASFLPVIKTPNADQFHDLDASDSSQFQNSKFQESLTVKRWWYSFCHTIAEISIAGNIHRLFRNEPRTTQGILLNWIQMHKQGMFTNLQYPWCAHETQNPHSKCTKRMCQNEESCEAVWSRRQSSRQPPIVKDCSTSVFRWSPICFAHICFAHKRTKSIMSINSFPAYNLIY